MLYFKGLLETSALFPNVPWGSIFTCLTLDLGFVILEGRSLKLYHVHRKELIPPILSINL